MLFRTPNSPGPTLSKVVVDPEGAGAYKRCPRTGHTIAEATASELA